MTYHCPLPEERLLSKIAVDESGCWLWNSYTLPTGYGQFSVYGRNTYAHRFSYEYFVGPIPEGLQIDHLCRVRNCVNPDHLDPVTNQENGRRGIKGVLTTHCPRGHEYNEENTYRRPRGAARVCRTCTRLSQRAKSVRS